MKIPKRDFRFSIGRLEGILGIGYFFFAWWSAKNIWSFGFGPKIGLWKHVYPKVDV